MRTGTVVTFYSYKGGVGRSFATANVACILAAWGCKVLLVDWDLEAPGLENYFCKIAKPTTEGLLQLIERIDAGERPSWRNSVNPVDLPSSMQEEGGKLDLVSAGYNKTDYISRIQKIDWGKLYSQHDFGNRIEHWRYEWVQEYDFVLLDSRTGVSDIGGICTAQLPDFLVFMFTANEQSLHGAVDVANRAIAARDRLPYDRSRLLAVPVPSRFDGREEYKLADSWKARFLESVKDFYSNWAAQGISLQTLLAHTTIPYVTYWSFGEELAAIQEHELNASESITYSLSSIAALLAHKLARTDSLVESRDSYVKSAAKRHRQIVAEDSGTFSLFISHSSNDKAIALELASYLQRYGTNVFLDARDVGSTDHWERKIENAIETARYYLVLIGNGVSEWQSRELRHFLRTNIEKESPSLVIPVLLPGASVESMPRALLSYSYVRTPASSPEVIASLLAQRIPEFLKNIPLRPVRISIVGSCKSNDNELPAFASACRELGRFLARRGFQLILGSSDERTADFYVMDGLRQLNERTALTILRPTEREGSEHFDMMAGGMNVERRFVKGKWRDVRDTQADLCDIGVVLGGGVGTSEFIDAAKKATRPLLPLGLFSGVVVDRWDELTGDLQTQGVPNSLCEKLKASYSDELVESCMKYLVRNLAGNIQIPVGWHLE